MTRIFGFQGIEHNAHIPFGVQNVLSNLQEAVQITYEKGWHAYGLGFIVINNNQAQGFSVYKGYRGITSNDNISSLLPTELHTALANNPTSLFAVLQNNPDNGEEDFGHDKGREFPLQSENWFAMTMGWWSNDNFSDEKLPWYNPTRPARSIVQYLETKPKSVDFGWIDQRRTPFIIAVKKDGQAVFVVDKYTGQNAKGFCYISENNQGLIHYQGVRDQDGKQV